jgi:hypothetical protein
MAITVMFISTVTMMITQAAYATRDEGGLSSSLDEIDDCESDELPALIDGTTRCMRAGECYSYDVEGKDVKHCNFMMSSSSD